MEGRRKGPPDQNTGHEIVRQYAIGIHAAGRRASVIVEQTKGRATRCGSGYDGGSLEEILCDSGIEDDISANGNELFPFGPSPLSFAAGLEPSRQRRWSM